MVVYFNGTCELIRKRPLSGKKKVTKEMKTNAQILNQHVEKFICVCYQ